MSVLRDTAMEAQRSRLPQMAAALSYRTVFGLLPVVAIGLWILHKVVSPVELENMITQGLEFFGLSSISVSQAAAAEVVGKSDSASQLFGPPLPPEMQAAAAEEATQSLKQFITALVARINGISFGAIGMVGVAMLIYAAISMIVEIERAFNQIFRVPQGRSWSRRIVNYWTLLTLGSLGLFLTFFIQQRFGAWVAEWTTDEKSGAFSLTLIGYLTQILVSAAVLVLIYMVVPNTKVRFLPALWGALLAAALFEATKYGFAKYVEFSGSKSYARLYGSLALIPLFLLWVYVTWIIILFGVQLAYQLQHGRARTRAQPISDFGPAVVEPTSALSVMSALGMAFNEGRTLDVGAISRQARLPDPAVRIVLARLAERRWVHVLESTHATEDAEPTYTLARPPSAIRIADLLRLGFELAGSREDADPGAPARSMLDRFHEAQIRAAADDTLADIVGTSTLAEADRPLPDFETARTFGPSDDAEKVSAALLRGSSDDGDDPSPPLTGNRRPESPPA